MHSKRFLVECLDERVALGRASEIIHFVQWDGDAWRCLGEKSLLFIRCASGFPLDECIVAWSERNRKEHSPKGHCPEASDISNPGGGSTGDNHGQVHQGSLTSGVDSSTTLDNPSVGVVEPLLQREIQRGPDFLRDRSVRLNADLSSDQERWHPDHPKTGVLYLGRINQGMVAGRPPIEFRRGRFSPRFFIVKEDHKFQRIADPKRHMSDKKRKELLTERDRVGMSS